jgi:anthranilate phosphoribosyltransferase
VTSLSAAQQPDWPTLLSSLIKGDDLPTEATNWAMAEIMAGNATDAQVAGFLVALRAKGETVAEFTGLVQAMVAAARPLSVSGRTLDIVGTGGDRQNTVNISTMAALVSAGAGARVVKHGNRAASSASGSADVIGALGVRLDLTDLLFRQRLPSVHALRRARALPAADRHRVQLHGAADQSLRPCQLGHRLCR